MSKKYVLVTYNHKTEETTFDYYDELHEAKKDVLALSREGIHPPAQIDIERFMQVGQRSLSVPKKQSLITYTINDNARHSPCPCKGHEKKR